MKKSDIKYFYEVEPLIDMNNFVELLFASFANNELARNFDNMFNIKTVTVLSLNYREIIKNIMYIENVLETGFSKIIDIEKYYYQQEQWENEFSNSVSNYLKKTSNKFAFENGVLEMDYTKEELKRILSNYDDDLLNVASHFATLLTTSFYDDNFMMKKTK